MSDENPLALVLADSIRDTGVVSKYRVYVIEGELRRLHAEVERLNGLVDDYKGLWREAYTLLKERDTAAPAPVAVKYELHLPDGDPRTARVVFSERKGDTVELCVALSEPPVTAPVAQSVWLVVTGETHNGQETYTRHDERPPLCEAERLHGITGEAP